MTSVMQRTDVSVALDAAHSLVDELHAADLTADRDDVLLDQLRELERLQRRLTSLSYALVNEADSRALPSVYGARSMTSFLRGVLRLDPEEAHARIKAAEAAGPRRALTGEPLQPIFEQVAAAQAAGAISQHHARIVEKTIDQLPDEAQAERGLQIERDLVNAARSFDPSGLAKIAQRLRDCYDPDGALDDYERRERERDLGVQQRPDGSGTCSGSLSAELTERLLVLFDSVAAPKPSPDGTRDPRTAGQRRHDALLAALRMVEATGKGLARLGHGALVPASAALRIAGGDLRLLAVVIDRIKGVTAYSSAHRLFTEAQRLAIIGRDGGCTFPNCDAPPGQCEIHHVVEYCEGGPTRVDNGALLCGYNHRHFQEQGWECLMINGRVHWRPPPWIDPERKPLRNLLHDTG